METYKRLLQFVKPYTKRLMITMFVMVGTALLTAASFYVIKPVIDKILANPDKAEAVKYIRMLPIAIIVIYALKGVFTYAQGYLINWIGNKIILDMREQLYRHVTNLSMKYFNNQKIGVLISRITNDVNMVQGAIANVLGNIVGSGLNIIGLVFMLFYLNWKFALMAILIFPVAVLPIVAFGKKMKHAARGSQEKMGDITAVLNESFNGIRIVKAFGMEEYERKRFKEDLRRFFDYSMRGVRASSLSSPTMETIGAVGIALIIYVAGQAVIGGTLTTGTFFAFIAGITGLYPQVKKLNDMNNTIQQALASAERVYEVLDTKPDIIDADDAAPITSFSSGIEFKDVKFSYVTGEPVLGGVSFEIKKGQIFAVVGPSGAGKSTIADILARFYDVDSGQVMIDGADIRHIKLDSLRKNIGIVTQETILFNDTIKANIAYGQSELNEDDVIAAAKAANAHDFILKQADRKSVV
jgi:subfamily B ATP-binding cassette protein MsbA